MQIYLHKVHLSVLIKPKNQEQVLWLTVELLFSTQSNTDKSLLNLRHPPLKHTFEISKKETTLSDGGQTLQWVAQRGFGDSTHLTF